MVERIPVESSTRSFSGLTNAYVVGSQDALLVDPAAASPELDTVVRNRSVSHVAVTHHHPDHVGAVSRYASEFDLTVWARTGRSTDFESAAGIAPDRTFSPGSVIPSGTGVGIIDTPGHASEHVSFVTDGAVLAGDLVVASGSVVVGPPDGDMRAYLSSLRRLHAANPARLYPAHGPIIDDSRDTCERLITHRLRREALVRSAVERGCETPAEIVEEVYEKDVSAVYELAKATVVAHLEKLDVEGDVEWDGSRAGWV